MNRIGTFVIWGRMSSLGQYWWHSHAMYFAGGKALRTLALETTKGCTEQPRDHLSDRRKCVLQN